MNPIAQFADVHKTYPGADRAALSNFSLDVAPGEIVVIVGPNGSGKTTAMEMLPGLRRPTTGTVSVHGQPVKGPGRQRLRMGVQLQNAGLPMRIRVKEAFTAVSCLYTDPGPVERIRSALGLDPYMKEMVENLSGGWQRRLDVALACLGHPTLLVLDEPTSGLDPVARAELWEFLRGLRHEGAAILASTHDLAEAEAFADRLVVLTKGRIVLSGPVNQVLSQAGGEWRVRTLGSDDRVHAIAQARGMRFLACADGHTALGERELIIELAESLESARQSGDVGYTDLMRGPVRLEDVFAHAVQESNAHDHR